MQDIHKQIIYRGFVLQVFLGPANISGAVSQNRAKKTPTSLSTTRPVSFDTHRDKASREFYGKSKVKSQAI